MSADAAFQGHYPLGRFHLRWTTGEREFAGRPGYAVYDYGRRITICWPDRQEAQRHLEAIARIYARYGW